MESEIKTQARISKSDPVHFSSGVWTDYGAIGWIDAATQHAQGCGFDRVEIEVRDAIDPTREPAIFEIIKETTYVYTNPRQGAQ